MSQLPQDTQVSNTQDDSTFAQQPPPSIPIGGKEGEAIDMSSSQLPLKAVGQEIELPSEVISHGVAVTPQTVSLPAPIVQAGVVPIGTNIPVQPQAAKGASLPLSDEQIAKALHESVTSSIRWLAEWCVRQIKLVHGVVKGK